MKNDLREVVAADGDIIEYLCGTGPFKGVWFSEGMPSGERGAYWWRTHLREAIARERDAAIAAARPAIGEECARKADHAAKLCGNARGTFKDLPGADVKYSACIDVARDIAAAIRSATR